MEINLNYTVRGTGYPLILLHGNGEDSSYFKKQVGPFSQYFRVIAVDTRGHGQSPRGTAPFTLSQFVDDLKYFMHANNIEKAHILGFSDGANIALIFALKYPSMVNRIILNGANLSPAGIKLYVQLPIIFAYGIVSLISIFNNKLYIKKEILGLMVREPKIKPNDLKGLTMPALVITGTKDMIKEKHSSLIAASLPNANFVKINGDHFIAVKNPDPFNTAVLKFLRQ